MGTMATQNVDRAFKGPVDVFSRTLRERGLLGLYRGGDSWIAFAGPRSAVRFGAFEALTAIAQQNGYDRSSSVDTVCGFWAGEKQSECLRTVIQVVPGPRV